MNAENTLAPTLRARNAARLHAQAEAAASAKPFETVPEIDLAALFGETTDATAITADAIRRACTEVGFFYVTGHGVDPDLVADVFVATEAFFALPQEQKDSLSILHSDKMRGPISIATSDLPAPELLIQPTLAREAQAVRGYRRSPRRAGARIEGRAAASMPTAD